MSDKQTKNYFNDLAEINVNDQVDKKGQFNYLSWSFAWGELKKKHPNATYNIHRFGEDNKPYLYDADLGYMVFTDVTIDDLTHEMWLPVMNFRNQAMKKGEATMMDINKAIMRCLTKNIGMHGLGLYIYAGEDLPEPTVPTTKAQAEKIKELYTDQEIQAMFMKKGYKSFKDLPTTEADVWINHRDKPKKSVDLDKKSK